MSLQIFLPFKIFAEAKNVRRIVAETNDGLYGFLPQRLDCVAVLIPGILKYETVNEGTQYIAVDEGVLVKTDKQVLVSVRNAIGGADLGQLHESVEKEFTNLNENERNNRAVMAKLEGSLIRRLQNFYRQ